MTRTEAIAATAVEVDGGAVLLLGRSGAGKSTLAIGMIALGARLIADDLVNLQIDGQRLLAAGTGRLTGVIEARGVGLLRAPIADTPVCVAFAVDLDLTESARLPPLRRRAILGVEVPLIGNPGRLDPASVMLAARTGGPIDPETAI